MITIPSTEAILRRVKTVAAKESDTATARRVYQQAIAKAEVIRQSVDEFEEATKAVLIAAEYLRLEFEEVKIAFALARTHGLELEVERWARLRDLARTTDAASVRAELAHTAMAASSV